MSVEHKNITDPEIHEPKGAAAASSGSVYHTDGAGSGDWVRLGYGCSTLTGDGTAQTSTSATFQAINATNFSAGTTTWANNQTGYGMSFDTTGGYFTISDAGTYLVNYGVSFDSNDASTSEFQVTIGVDSGSGIISKEANTTNYLSQTVSGLILYVSGTCMPTLSAGDKLYIMIRRNSGTGDIGFYSGNFAIHRVV